MFTVILTLFIFHLLPVKADSDIDGKTVSFTQFINEMAKCSRYTTF